MVRQSQLTVTLERRSMKRSRNTRGWKNCSRECGRWKLKYPHRPSVDILLHWEVWPPQTERRSPAHSTYNISISLKNVAQGAPKTTAENNLETLMWLFTLIFLYLKSINSPRLTVKNPHEKCICLPYYRTTIWLIVLIFLCKIFLVIGHYRVLSSLQLRLSISLQMIMNYPSRAWHVSLCYCVIKMVSSYYRTGENNKKTGINWE